MDLLSVLFIGNFVEEGIEALEDIKLQFFIQQLYWIFGRAWACHAFSATREDLVELTGSLSVEPGEMSCRPL